ncbi:MAG TPA: hypothetical protein VFQ61_25770 [Polyangiaceae bacterium]|nr:hypothetical protein [Polyangiaceae bacterium]
MRALTAALSVVLWCSSAQAAEPTNASAKGKPGIKSRAELDAEAPRTGTIERESRPTRNQENAADESVPSEPGGVESGGEPTNEAQLTSRDTASIADGVFARGPYLHTFASVGYGRGMRFNNPFRLASPAGERADGLSLTAPYLDLSIAGLLGPPRGLQHGVMLRTSIALTGVPQEVLSVGYVVARALGNAALGYARLSVPIVLRPDLNAGGELGLGAAYWLRAGIGVSAELAGSLFAGAATWESDPTLIPVVSLAISACFEYEVLP